MDVAPIYFELSHVGQLAPTVVHADETAFDWCDLGDGIVVAKH